MPRKKDPVPTRKVPCSFSWQARDEDHLCQCTNNDSEHRGNHRCWCGRTHGN